MPERLRGFTTRRCINPLYLYLYLAEDCQLVPDLSARQLQSADAAICVARHTSNIFGDRCFAAAGPRLWISLPINLRQCHSLEQFKRLLKMLKTFLFSAWNHGALWHLPKSVPRGSWTLPLQQTGEDTIRQAWWCRATLHLSHPWGRTLGQPVRQASAGGEGGTCHLIRTEKESKEGATASHLRCWSPLN